jgi:hypothetical protein
VIVTARLQGRPTPSNFFQSYWPTIAARFVSTLSLTLLFAVPGVAEGGQLPTDAPRQPIQELIRTEVVYPQEKGEFQLTLRSTADKGRHGSVFAFPIQAEFGLTDAWQLEVEWRSYSRVRAGDVVSSGLGAYSIGTKYSFMNIGGSGLHAAVGLELDLAGGLTSAGSREDNLEWEPFMAFALDLPSRVQAFVHTGKAFTIGGADRDAADGAMDDAANVQWNAGALVALRRVTLAVEINLLSKGSPWRPGGERYATPSLTFPTAGSWEVGLGMPIGLGRSSDRFGVAVLAIFEK